MVAQRVAAFLDGATKTLDVAIYDLRLEDSPGNTLLNSFESAVKRGVVTRLMFNQDHAMAIPVPPPPQIDWAFVDRLRSTGVQVMPIPGIPDLMHHKYVVRDAASVLTGSTNWTNDSWTREENVIIKIPSTPLAAEYAKNFAELWETGRVEGSGKYDLAGVPVVYQDTPVKTHVVFAPGRGRQMAHMIADRIAHARRRIRVCSPVITAGVILGTLGDLAHKSHPDFKGVFDRTQMAEVLGQWRVDPHATWKGPAFQAVSSALAFASKVTTPYTPTSVHDFMHAKITVVDNTVFTGSYNLSHAGEDNAENLLALDSAPLADRFVEFIDAVFARYAATPAAARQ